MLAFLAGVLVGSRRLAHVERLRWNPAVHRILGIKRFVSDTTLSRFLRRFTAGKVSEVFESVMRWQLELIAPDNEILDLDSSIMARYGKQEGALLGYNPKKHRRPSHHPLIATLGTRPWVERVVEGDWRSVVIFPDAQRPSADLVRRWVHARWDEEWLRRIDPTVASRSQLPSSPGREDGLPVDPIFGVLPDDGILRSKSQGASTTGQDPSASGPASG